MSKEKEKALVSISSDKKEVEEKLVKGERAKKETENVLWRQKYIEGNRKLLDEAKKRQKERNILLRKHNVCVTLDQKFDVKYFMKGNVCLQRYI